MSSDSEAVTNDPTANREDIEVENNSISQGSAEIERERTDANIDVSSLVRVDSKEGEPQPTEREPKEKDKEEEEPHPTELELKEEGGSQPTELNPKEEGDDDTEVNASPKNQEKPGADLVDSAKDISKQSFPKCSTGPYSLVSLIDEIPCINQELEGTNGALPTSIESWELNIYVGTSKGELLHFFKLDDEFGYMLISRQRISSKGFAAVKKIILLPEISRALILCNSSVSCFMMPEMSPASIGKIKDVQDITLDISSYKLDEKHSNKVVQVASGKQGITAIVFTSKSLRFILITTDTIKLVKDLNYQNIAAGVRSSNLAFVGTSSSYDILDLEKGKKTPIFPISSDSHSNLQPLIIPISTEEYLLSCGTSSEESAIGMVVNRAGDISRGTVSWIKYPKHVISDYPHIVASFGDLVHVHSIQDQELLQTLEFEKPVQVATVSHVFNRKFDEIIDFIKLVPLVMDKDHWQDKAEFEVQNAKKFATVTSSSVLFSAEEGVKLLIPTPMLKRILRLSNGDHLESVYDDMEDEIKTIDKTTDYGMIQYRFSRIASCLTLLKHFQFDRAFEYYIDNKLDPQIAIYLFTDDLSLLYGEFWLYNGLKSKMEALREKFQSIIVNKGPNDDEMVLQFAMDEFYKLLIKKYFTTKDMEFDLQTQKSIAVIHFLNECSSRSFSSMEAIDNFVESTDVQFCSTEIIEQLKKNQMHTVLVAFYKLMGRHQDALKTVAELGSGNLKDSRFQEIFKTDEDLYKFLIDYSVENVTDEDSLWKIGQWLLEKSPEYAVIFFSSPHLKADISEMKVIKLLNEKNLGELSTRYLEVLLLERNEIQFIADLIFEITRNLVEELRNDAIVVSEFNESIETFQKMDSPKLSFAKFISIEFRRFSNKKVCKLHNQLFNYLLITTKDSTTITRETNVTIVKYCKETLEPFANQLPYIMSLLDFKAGDYANCIDKLCSLTDHKTAEFVATTLTIPYNLANFDDKVDKFIEIHRSRVSTQNIEDIGDEDATIAVTSIATVGEGSDSLTQELLLQIFENYLKLNNFKLIEIFLDAHHIFDISFNENDDLNQTFSMFEMVLHKLPPSFPVSMINRFLTTSIIKLRDAEQNKIKVKNLQKAMNKKLKVLQKELKE